MEIVTYVINSFLQCMVLGIYLKNMLGLKRRPVFLWITWLAMEILNRGYTWVLEQLKISDAFAAICTALYFMATISVVAVINCGGKFGKKILFSVLYGLFGIALEMIFLNMFIITGTATVEDMQNNPILTLIIYVVIQMTTFGIVILLTFVRGGESTDEAFDERKEWIASVPSLLCLAAVFLQCVNLLKSKSTTSEEIALLAVLVGIDFSCYFFYDLQRKESLLESENALYASQVQMYQKRYEDIREIRQEIDAFQHDIKNHVGVLRRLCDVGEENSEEAVKDIREYLDSMESNYYESEKMTDTGNIVIDSVIDMKKSYAASLGIQVDVAAFLPEDMDFDGRDAITLLANLFDNAIEACQKADTDKKIDLEIQYHKSDLLIYMENTCDGSMDGLGGTETDPLPETGRQEKQKHGHGMRNMLRTVEKYQGSFRWKGENGIFSVEIVLSDFAKEKTMAL